MTSVAVVGSLPVAVEQCCRWVTLHCCKQSSDSFSWRPGLRVREGDQVSTLVHVTHALQILMNIWISPTPLQAPSRYPTARYPVALQGT